MTQSRSECVLHEGLSYSNADPLLKLDLFLPPATVRTVPCVMVIAGGGFLAQDGQRFRHFAVIPCGERICGCPHRLSWAAPIFLHDCGSKRSSLANLIQS
jgi:hypothetical protein